MAVAQPPDQREALQHSEEILLQELQRVDEILLEELQSVDAMLLRIAAAIDQLPQRVASTIRRESPGSLPADPAGRRASTRPFDPYGEDDVAVSVASDNESAAREVVAFAVLATGIALVGLIVAVLL